MKLRYIITSFAIISAVMIGSFICPTSFADNRKSTDSELPVSGVSVDLDDGTSYEDKYGISASANAADIVEIIDLPIITDDSVSENSGNTVIVYGTTDEGAVVAQMIISPFGQGIEKATILDSEVARREAEAAALDPENFSNLVIAQVTNYVNVRSTPGEDGEIVGKLYDDSVGNFLGEENGWYLIESGKVKGYVKAEFCVTGDEAIELAKTVGTRMATVTTTTLKVRGEASTDSEVLGLVPISDDLVVVDELEEWVKVSTEEGEGYVSKEYVALRTDFVRAESKAEEEARLAKERQAQLEAQAAAERARQNSVQASANTNNNNNNSSNNKTYNAPTFSDNSMGTEVVKYACQFVGNPYVYGGSSLTNGTDCSGFVMSVYAAYGVKLPHSSTADRTQGYAVEGGLANAQPGDIVCYSGHVAIYAGNGQIVHASTSKTGIIISNANYRDVLAVRRIF